MVTLLARAAQAALKVRKMRKTGKNIRMTKEQADALEKAIKAKARLKKLLGLEKKVKGKGNNKGKIGGG